MINTEMDVETDACNEKLHWIHCNLCYELYIKKERRFFLFACNHITCEKCTAQLPTESMPTHKCPICAKIVRSREINNALPQSIKELFHPRPWLMNLPTVRILQFQEKHRTHLYRGMEKIAQNIMELEDKLEAERSRAKSKFEELEGLRLERKNSERAIHQLNKRRKVSEEAVVETVQPKDAYRSTDESGIGSIQSEPIRPRCSRTEYSSTIQHVANYNAPGTSGVRMPNPSAEDIISFTHQPEHTFDL